MPRFYKRLPGTIPRKFINNDDLQKAVDEVQSGKLTYREAADKYRVDKMKIFRKCKQIHQKKCGGQTTLTDNEEAVLKDNLLVEPGKSVQNVCQSESESEVLADDSEETSEEQSTNSDSDEEEEPVVNLREEQEPQVDYMSIMAEEFLVVKLKDSITKSDKLYVAKVSSTTENSAKTTRVVEVKFLKLYRSHRDIFVWPDIEESSEVYPHEILRRLPPPVNIRYGRLKFPENVV